MVKTTWRSFVLVAGFLAGPAMAAAGPFVQYGLNSDDEAPYATDPVGGFTFTGISTNPAGASGAARFYGQSDYGVGRAALSASGPGFDAFLSSGWTDTLTFSSPGMSGQAGFVTVTLNYDWTMSAGSGGSSVTRADVVFGLTLDPAADSFVRIVSEGIHRVCSPTCNDTHSPSTLYSYDPVHYTFVPIAPAGAAPGSISFAVPIVFGGTYTSDVELDVLVAALGLDGGAESDASVDASHSLHWGGISDVTDADGRSVEYTLQSGSGTDYVHAITQAVPEPQTYALMLAGLILLASAQRQRRQRTGRPDRVAAPRA